MICQLLPSRSANHRSLHAPDLRRYMRVLPTTALGHRCAGESVGDTVACRGSASVEVGTGGLVAGLQRQFGPAGFLMVACPAADLTASL